MTNGQICFIHEYCTDCPIRKECAVRPIFYSDKDYELYRQQTLMYSSIIAKRLKFPNAFIPAGLNIGLQMMDKRRAKEIKEHPTYSPE